MVFHRVPNPPKAPLAFSIIPWLLLQTLVATLSKSWLSILVSWRSRISVFEAFMMSLSSSSFLFLPNPRHFQEIRFINYLGGMTSLLGRPWSASLSIWHWSVVWLLVAILLGCLCRVLCLFLLSLISFLFLFSLAWPEHRLRLRTHNLTRPPLPLFMDLLPFLRGSCVALLLLSSLGFLWLQGSDFHLFLPLGSLLMSFLLLFPQHFLKTELWRCYFFLCHIYFLGPWIEWGLSFHSYGL